MKKFFLGLALLGMTSLSLAACTGGEEESTPANETAPVVEEVVEPEVVEEPAEAETEATDVEVEADAEATVK